MLASAGVTAEFVRAPKILDAIVSSIATQSTVTEEHVFITGITDVGITRILKTKTRKLGSTAVKV
jgi:hypothetical protein